MDGLLKQTVKLPDGTRVPQLGQGTWNMGDKSSKREEEIATLRLGVELGMSVIDTAEMYGEGNSESMVGEAMKGIRDEVFLVSKVYPHHSGLSKIASSCEASLKRLNTDRLDLYLLHWRGNVPLSETIEGMEKLVDRGLILRWGVSNFDTSDMRELTSLLHGTHCVVNQVLYHLGSRGIEYDLLPWHREHQIPIMAYSPLAQGGSLRQGLLEHKVVNEIADQHGVEPMQLLLAWTIRNEQVIAIPKASTTAHVMHNAAARQIQLLDEDIRKLDSIFPAPYKKMALDMI